MKFAKFVINVVVVLVLGCTFSYLSRIDTKDEPNAPQAPQAQHKTPLEAQRESIPPELRGVYEDYQRRIREAYAVPCPPTRTPQEHAELREWIKDSYEREWQRTLEEWEARQ